MFHLFIVAILLVKLLHFIKFLPLFCPFFQLHLKKLVSFLLRHETLNSSQLVTCVWTSKFSTFTLSSRQTTIGEVRLADSDHRPAKLIRIVLILAV